ncbi:gliding motility-associated C-terminal domain-containing protein [Fulvivirgaceae bacterium PWU4]|uniref:Gliding motility-associated C-terminal domain-containing protein n=1 Tax=Chryseosolibacter histidini TaxID=2782349 RepID=A0AAP2DP35_9BACT|nr:gliding motility-associated C-terminal domain-containing protein [Chryseosolibacter histidini]MBT1699905.1 gliding motility-associated C-terminal domain-containing protein [Chryseosolibacter histidini]
MKKVLLLALFLGSYTFTLAQATESNCANGVDDDNDGFIDCFDGDCANNNVCDGTYTGNDKLCQLPKPPGSDFAMLLKNTSTDWVSTTHGRFVIGDMDRDGTPDVVTAHYGYDKVFVLDGKTLAVKFSGDTRYDNPERYDITIGNINNDNCAEIYVAEQNDGDFYISKFDCKAVRQWTKKVKGRPYTMALADLNQDGKSELYYRNEIMDAETGTILVQGTGDWNEVDAGSVAVDILPDNACTRCDGLELVAGGVIYGVNVGNGTANNGSVSIEKKFNDLPGLGGIKYFPKGIDFSNDNNFVNSMTSVADYDLDGNLDVLMSGASSNSPQSSVTAFYWNVSKNTFKTYKPKQSDGNGWKYGMGRINIADIDGNGQMNAAFVSGSRLFVLDENLNVLKIKSKAGVDSADWIIEIEEQSSGFTSTTVFDFNNDGASEIVYRDEDYLYIFNGKTGKPSPPITCISQTTNDYPVVADVDADGATEICVICRADGQTTSNAGVIRTYKSSLEPWVSARKVWNQHAYFNVNVNDDLTIPKIQQKHHLVFSENVCTPGKNRALNSFLNQSAILDSKGCKTMASADVSFIANPQLMNVTAPTCPNQNFTVSFTIKNTGDLVLNGNLPITFYSGDPRVAGAVKLNTVQIPLANFAVGATLQQNNITVNGTGKTFTLYAVLNDAGTSIPIALPNTNFTECNYINNVVSAQVNPATFPLTTAVTDHIQCGGAPTAANGSAQAYKLEGGSQVTVGYTFYWFNGGTVGDTTTAVYKGAVRSPLTNGTYSVVAYHKAFRCGSAPAVVNVGVSNRNISATINIDHAYTNCNAPDGKLTVTPDGGLPVSNFTYEWYEGTGTGTGTKLSVTNVLTGAKGLTYSVVVTEIASGCKTLESETVPDQTAQFTVSANATLANCNPLNSGSASANVGGVTAGYEFRWYNGNTVKTSPDFTGITYSSLTAGNYTVVAKNLATGCISGPFIQPVGSVAGVTTSITSFTPQTACVGKNGTAIAAVTGGAATFKWYKGSNTLAVNEVLPAPGANLTGAAAGTYTVLATNNATGCQDTEEVTIVDNIVYPAATPTPTPQTNCFPANGQVTTTATNGPHIFYWFDGNVGTPDTTAAAGQVDFKGQTYTGRAAGFYTVVAVNKTTKCPSPAVPVQVVNNTAAITATPTPVHNTSCLLASPNGGASATASGAPSGSYKFRWFTGGDTTSFIVQNNTLTNRAPGTYTVKAISLVTGCFGTQVVTVNNISAKPVLSLNKTDNTVCTASAGYTGSVTASFSSNPNSLPAHTYTYAWTKNGSGIGGTTASQTGLNGATYAVTVTNQTLNCTSDPASIAVVDVPALPVLVTSSTGSTNCIPGAGGSKINGSAQLTSIDGTGIASVTGYTFQWHTGTGTGSPISVATNPTANSSKLDKVQGGTTNNFTVLVTKTSTGCSNTATVLVADASVKPVLTLKNTPNSICDATIAGTSKDGTVSRDTYTYAGTYTGTQTLIYNWYDGTTTGAPHTPATTNHPTASITQLAAGFYSGTVTIDELGCTSALATTEVKDVVALPVIVTQPTPSTNCTTGTGLENGAAEVTKLNGANVTAATPGFTYAWFTGAGTGTPSTKPTANQIKLDKIQGGATNNYTVEVTQLSNGCKNTATVLVTDGSVKPVLTLTNTPNSICDATIAGTPKNGTVSRNTYTYTGAYAGTQTLVYNWYDGTTTAMAHTPATTNHPTASINQLPAAFYSATVTINELGCTSALATTEVKDVVSLPVIVTKATPSTNCTVGTGLENGAAEVTKLNGANVTAATPGFTYAWFTGSGTGTPSPKPTANQIKLNLIQGGATNNYTVEVTQLSNGCKNTATVLVTDGSVKPTLTLKNTSNSICDATIAGTPKNGTVTQNTYNYTGAYTGAMTLTYNWYDGTTTAVAHTPATTVPPTIGITQLGAGFYSATVTINELGCTSALATREVKDAVALPVIETLATPSTNCTMGAAFENGAAAVTKLNGVNVTGPTTAGFTYKWFDGTGTAVASTKPTAGQSKLNLIQGGPTNNYTVEVTRLSNGCKNTATVLVTDASVKPVLTLKNTPNSICDAAIAGTSKNGTVSQDTYSYTGGYTGTMTLTYNWYDGTTTAVAHAPATTTPPTTGIVNLAAGFYSGTVTINQLGCTSALVTTEVQDVVALPVIETLATPSTNCTMGAAFENGAAEVTKLNGANVTAATPGFTYAWFTGIGTGTPNPKPTANQIKLDKIQGGATNNYTVEVTRLSNGCKNTATVLVTDGSVKPTLTLKMTPNTICDPMVAGVPGNIENGTASVDQLAYAGAYTGTKTYNYNWYDGQTTAVPHAAAVTATNITSLDAKFYSATATITELGCTSDLASVEVKDNLKLPTLSLSMTASTNCAGGTDNGTATVAVTNTAGGETYSYDWRKGPLVTSPAVPATTPGITGQEGNENYTVLVTINQTGCKDSGTILIQDNSKKPVIGPLAKTDNTHCTTPNGTAFVDETTNPITYHGTALASYTGFNLVWTGGPMAATVGPVDQYNNLPAGTYTLQVTAVTNPSNGNNDQCVSDPRTVTLVDNLVYPVVNTSILAQQTTCSGTPNGQVEATTTSTGTITFDWYAGLGVGAVGTELPEVALVDGRTTPVLASGDYTVLAINSGTQCKTTKSVFVPDNITLPVIATLTEAGAVTFCSAPNGQLTATPVGLTSTANGDFTIFYLNQNTSDPVTVKTHADHTQFTTTAGFSQFNLKPGFYSSMVRDEITKCESQVATVRINDMTVAATITIDAVKAATFCANTDGNIDVTITGPMGATYDVFWHKGGPTNTGPFDYITGTTQPKPVFGGGAVPAPVSAAPPGLVDPPDMWDLRDGAYSIEVIDQTTGCGAFRTEFVPFQNAPVINIVKRNSTVCDPLAGNGEIELQVDPSAVAGPKQYSYLLWTGSSGTATMPQVAGENCNDGVDNDGDGDVDTDDSKCKISYQGNPDYDLTFAGLNPGGYTIEIIDHSACSVFTTALIDVDALSPIVTINSVTANTACVDGSADGSVSITITKDPLDLTTAAPNYRITGVTSALATPATTPALFPVAMPTATARDLFRDAQFGFGFDGGFGAAMYQISVEEVNSGCTIDKFVNIPDQPVMPTITVAVTDDTFCAPKSNGSVNITAVGPATVNDYQYSWYNNATLPAPIYQANEAGGGRVFDATKAGYVAGVMGQGRGNQNYYVRSTRLAGPAGTKGVGCNSPAIGVVVQDKHVAPVPVLTSSPNTSCDPLIGEGSISIETTTVSPQAAVQNSLYTYSIMPAVVAPLTNRNGSLFKHYTALTHNGGAAYTVTTENQENACRTDNAISVLDAKYALAITAHTVNDKLVCNLDGDIAATEITIDRTLTSQAAEVFNASSATTINAGFAFRWFKGTPGTFTSGAPLQDGAGVPALITGTSLNVGTGGGNYPDAPATGGAGTYYVVGRRISAAGIFGANCETTPLRVEILDKSADPVITLTPFSNTSCDPALFEGEIDVDITDASPVTPPPGGFTFGYAWTASAGVTPPGPTAGNDGTDNHFNGLEEGTYDLTATNAQTGCVSVAHTTIIKNATPIFTQVIDVDPQLFCYNSGSIEVKSVGYEDRAGLPQNAPLVDFEFTWTRNAATVGNTAPLLDSANYGGISADANYFVVAKRIANGPGKDCSSAPIRLEIKDESKNPNVVLTPLSNTSCHATAFEGQITVKVTDSSPFPTTVPPTTVFSYTYAWTSATPPPAMPNVFNGNDNVFTNLKDNNYQLLVTNNETGCVHTESTDILKNTTPIFVQNVDIDPQLFCYNSGSLEVKGVTFQDRAGALQNAPLADFNFAWTRSAVAVGNTAALLDSANYGGISADANYFVVAKRMANGPGRDCESAPLQLEIKDESINPNVVLTPLSNTSCHATAFEGQITVKVTDASPFPTTVPATTVFSYTYAWTSATPPPAMPNVFDGNDNVFTNLRDNNYQLLVTNNETGCVHTESTDILKNTTPIFVQNVDIDPQLFCYNSGSLEVKGVTFQDRAGALQNAPLADFNFAWTRSAVAVGNTAALLDSANYGGISADANYFVVAKRMANGPGRDCESAPLKLEIKDESKKPNVLLTPFSNTSCHATAFEGEIKVKVTDASPFPTTVPATTVFSYTYAWTSATPPPAMPNVFDGNDNVFTNLKDNNYQLAVTNNETGCVFTANTTIIKNATPIFTQVTDADAQLVCYNSGSLEVKSVSYEDRAGAMQNAPLADFSFAWTRNGATVGNAAALLDSTNYSGISADANYFVVAKRIANGPGRDCESAPLRLEIKDESKNPNIVLTPFSNTSCALMTFEGEIDVDVTDASSFPTTVPATTVFTYAYNWTGSVMTPTGGGPAYNGVNNHFNGLRHGIYKLEVTNNQTGCISNAQTEVVENTTPIFVQDVDPDAQLFCVASGSLEVKQIRFVDRAGAPQTINTPVGLGDFTFTWFRGGTLGGNQVLTGASRLLDSTNYATVGADPDYYVVARRNANGPGLNCASAPFRVEIPDGRKYPVVTLTTTPNTVCDNNYLGSLEVDIVDQSTVPGSPVGTPYDYDFAWTSTPAAASATLGVGPFSGVNNMFNNLQHATYNLVATNRDSKCASVMVQAVIQQILPTVEIKAVNKLDQTDCAPVNGSITINAASATHMSLPGIYTFAWSDAGGLITPQPVAPNNHILNGRAAGTYSIQGTKSGGPGSGCITPPFPVVIEDKTVKPAINLSSIANFACVAPFNGSISATVTEGLTTGTAGYTYEWFSGTTTGGAPLGGPSTTLTGLNARLQGDYAVRVVDINSPNSGCDNVATLPILFNPTDLFSNIEATAQTLCAPSQNGQLEVQLIKETVDGATTDFDVKNNAAHKARFSFQWFDETQAPLTGVVNGSAGGNVLPNREAGEYFVQITNNVGCTSLFSRSVVEDKNSYPTISLDNFVNPKLCVLPETPGELIVFADGTQDLTNYTFEWFEGPDETGTPVTVAFPNTLDNIFYNDPQEYTVRVTNNLTHCPSIATYKFATDTLDIRVVASAVPLSNCLTNNGRLFAAPLEGSTSLYAYEWYAGATVSGPIQFTTNDVTNAPMGVYTVIARDLNHNFCVSVPETTEVTDGRIYPPVVIEQKNPLTYCDPARPNGVARATVNGTIVGYSFDWFLGATAAGGTPFYNGAEVDGLRAVTYTAQATDVVTGCVGEKSILIENVPVKVPSPSVVILSHLTRCVPPPDGALQANVNGNTVDYTIQWYNGSSLKAVPDANGEFYRDLDQGPYTTTATDIVSGCVSAPVITQVLPLMKNPEFDITTVPTHCEANIGEAKFELLNDVQIKSVEWDINGVMQNTQIATALPKGSFTLTLTTSQDCKITKDFEILPEILVFNGISQNGDGQNDFFEISCIGDFPNNSVKIFNRAGTLVYQSKGYNNADIVFSGTSNEGLSLMGRELPEGTYFYIIDKGNGSKPKTGYLELLRK